LAIPVIKFFEYKLDKWREYIIRGDVITPNGKVHWGFALMLYLFFVVGNGKMFFVLNPIFMLIGSLFPDADHKRAPMGRFVPLWLFFSHRGFTHTLYALILFALPLMLFNWKWALSFAIGYFSHLILDVAHLLE
jgi:membrane-bound metal-dependent hydrolase YbcI (DUF457 family)